MTIKEEQALRMYSAGVHQKEITQVTGITQTKLYSLIAKSGIKYKTEDAEVLSDADIVGRSKEEINNYYKSLITELKAENRVLATKLLENASEEDKMNIPGR